MTQGFILVNVYSTRFIRVVNYCEKRLDDVTFSSILSSLAGGQAVGRQAHKKYI